MFLLKKCLKHWAAKLPPIKKTGRGRFEYLHMAKLIPGVAECFYSIWSPILVHAAPWTQDLKQNGQVQKKGVFTRRTLNHKVLKLTDGTASGQNHRVHTEWQWPATFRRTFHHDGKISPSWWGWGVHAHCPPPLTLSNITYKVAVYAFSWEADTLTLFLIYPCICTLWWKPGRGLFIPRSLNYIWCCMCFSWWKLWGC